MISQRTLIILNPHAGGGKAGQLWTTIEPLLWDTLGDLLVAITQRPEEVAPHLEMARSAGITRVIAIGGDGTNHFIINELARLNQQAPTAPRMTFGSIPMGTGRDWSRTLGTPTTPEMAVRWIAGASPIPVDLGAIHGEKQDFGYFLNIASVGASGLVAQRVMNSARRYRWTYLAAILQTLMTYQPPRFKVQLDGELWYEDKAYLVAVANGRFFGHGLMIAPDARADDGLFDVVIVENSPRLEVISALNTAYSGRHIKRSDVHVRQARKVEIEVGQPFPYERDGELFISNYTRLEVRPSALEMLTHSPLAASAAAT
jgi:YegS/Rv2252/BmrU family lipid kinase